MWQESVLLIKFEELFMVLEYTMSSHADNDECVQMILDIDREMMGAVQDNFALQNPIFSHLSYTADDGNPVNKSLDTFDVVDTIKSALTFDEAHATIIEDITRKISLLVGCLADEINMNLSLADFGLDSLIAIKLKNWIARTFQAALQTAEIFSSPSIDSLAKLVTRRSTLVSAQLKENTSADGTGARSRELPTTELYQMEHKCCRFADTLP
jgi:aryl carrier-like protein